MIDEEQLKKYYKEIEKTCIITRTLMPTLLQRDYPNGLSEKYRLSSKEKKELLNNETINELFIKQVEKRADEIKALANNTLEEYHQNELTYFIKHNPKFKEIIINHG